MLVQQHDLTLRVDSVTVNLRPYVRSVVRKMAEANPENGEILCDYINAELVERNIAEATRAWKLQVLTRLSAYFEHEKSFRSMAKKDILLYLNSLRKTIEQDPGQRWIGNYNNKVLVFTKFFRWLYRPNEPDYKKRKTPPCMSGIKQLPKKTKTPYKPSDLWTPAEHDVFLKYCPLKRDRCYHAMARDTSARPHELLKLRIGDVQFKIDQTTGKQYAEIVVSGKTKTPPPHLIQYRPVGADKAKIAKLEEIIHNAKPNTPFSELPSTSEISSAYGYDPEKYCPTCFRKFKRHATRKRVGEHRHYPIFAVCNPTGKNPGNVWEISTKAHYGNEHFAIFPEDLVARIINFASRRGDWVLDPFMGRGTTGIVCALTGRNFTGIDLYSENVRKAKKNILDANAGSYDSKLVEVVAREANLIKDLESGVRATLEAYLLADGSLSTK